MKVTNIYRFLIIQLLLAAVLLTACAQETATAETKEDEAQLQEAIEVTKSSQGTILVPIDYKDKQWFVGEDGVEVLPCEPPTPFYNGSEIQPLVQILDEKGEVVYERNQELDPRILLFEGPSKESHLLEEISFTLRLPLLTGMQTLEYTVDPQVKQSGEEQKPDLIVDLGSALERYEAAGAAEQEAPCQQPEYKPDQLDGKQ